MIDLGGGWCSGYKKIISCKIVKKFFFFCFSLLLLNTRGPQFVKKGKLIFIRWLGGVGWGQSGKNKKFPIRVVFLCVKFLKMAIAIAINFHKVNILHYGFFLSLCVRLDINSIYYSRPSES